jgi:hypothetical protein
MNRDGRSCGTCAKAHLAAEHLAGVNLECRAHPPAQDVGRYARFPQVRTDDYCHTDFERDPTLGAELEATQ